MPKRGDYADISMLSGPRLTLTLAVRAFCDLLEEPQLSERDLSKRFGLSKSVLSALINGQRKRPDLRTLIRMRELVVKELDSTALLLPLEELEQAHANLMAEDKARDQSLCWRCGAANIQHVRSVTAHSVNSEPADLPPVRRRGPDTMLPVPPATVDRQATLPGVWPGMADLTARLAAGQVADAVGVLRHTGIAATPSEAAVAIMTCAREGLDDAASSIISYAAQRPNGEIMQIAKLLLDDAHSASAKQLLELRLAS